MRSCNKQQQAMMILPIVMAVIYAIINRHGHNQRNHREMPKHSQEEPLKRNKEGHGNQPWSYKAASLTNATRALWGRHEYHYNTHTTTTNIAARMSIAATRAQQMQTATFCQPVREWRVICLARQRQLSSPSTWLTQTTTTASNSNNNKNKAIMTHMPRITHATITGQAANWVAWQSRWHRLQWRKNKCKQWQQKIQFFLYSKNKEDACCSLLWPGNSNFKVSPKRKNNFGGLSIIIMPRLVARLGNLA
jgi:hypothetical protein